MADPAAPAPVAPPTDKTPREKWTEQLMDLEKQIRELNKDIERRREDEIVLRAMLETKDKELVTARGELSGAKADSRLYLKRSNELRKQLMEREDFKQIGSLRAEVSVITSRCDDLRKKLQAANEETRQAKVSASTAAERFKVLESTAQTMQWARDQAQKRESAAFQRVAELDLALSKANANAVSEKESKDAACRVITRVADIHKKEHPNKLAHFGPCIALGNA